MIRRLTAASAALLPFLLFAGCGDDSSGPTGTGGAGGAPADFSGSWALALEVIQINQDGPGRACTSDLGELFSWDVVITLPARDR